MSDKIGPGSDVKLHLQDWYDKPGHDVMIVAHGLMCYRIDGDTVWTGAAWVHPDYRRRGIMSTVVLMICRKHADKKYLKSLTNPSLQSVTKMYLKMGRNKPTETPEGLLWKDRISDILMKNT